MQTPQMGELSWNGTSPLLLARTTIALDMRNCVVYICLAEGATGFFLLAVSVANYTASCVE